MLEGDPGLGGVADRDVAELREENVKVFWGGFSGVFVVEALDDSFDSVGTSALLFPDFVRFSMLPILDKNFDFSCDVPLTGEGGVPPLVLSPAFRSDGGCFACSGSSGVDLGIEAAIAAMFGVLTGRARTGSCRSELGPSEEDGGEGLVLESSGGGCTALVGDIASCEEADEVLRPLSTLLFGFRVVASRPMSSILRGRG